MDIYTNILHSRYPLHVGFVLNKMKDFILALV